MNIIALYPIGPESHAVPPNERMAFLGHIAIINDSILSLGQRGTQIITDSIILSAYNPSAWEIIDFRALEKIIFLTL
jgi:hypothetical protein